MKVLCIYPALLKVTEMRPRTPKGESSGASISLSTVCSSRRRSPDSTVMAPESSRVRDGFSFGRRTAQLHESPRDTVAIGYDVSDSATSRCQPRVASVPY